MKDNNSYFKYFSLVTEIGITMVFSVLSFGLLGIFIVSKFLLPQWIIILFVLLGVIIGFYLIYRKIIKTEEK